MNAYKVDAIVTKNGLTILEMLPLPIGSSVEVIILDKGMSNPKELLSQSDRSSPTITLESEYLAGVSSLMNGSQRQMSQPIKIYNRFDVVIVPFPFTDSSITNA